MFKRAIITGATGAIGTALTKYLTSEGIEVLVVTREDSKRNGNILTDDLVKVKYCPIDQLENLENDADFDYDIFYHFAWEGAAGPGRNDMYMQNRNVKHALDAVILAKRFGCKAFIGAGSQAEYGRFDGVLKPDTPVNPETGYGYAKLCAGEMTRELAHQIGLRHVWMRVLSVYGPNDGSQSMVMSTIEKLKKMEVPEFTKGEQTWDYLFSADAAKAFYLAGKTVLENEIADGKIYVLGSGQARPLAEYISIIRDTVNQDAEIKLGAIPYSEKQVMHLVADITELKKDMGFEPDFGFEEGIKILIDNY